MKINVDNANVFFKVENGKLEMCLTVYDEDSKGERVFFLDGIFNQDEDIQELTLSHCLKDSMPFYTGKDIVLKALDK